MNALYEQVLRGMMATPEAKISEIELVPDRTGIHPVAGVVTPRRLRVFLHRQIHPGCHVRAALVVIAYNVVAQE